MHWSAQGRSMDPSLQLMWGAPSLQLSHSGLQLLVKLLGRPSQLTVAIYTSYLHWHTHSIRSIFSIKCFLAKPEACNCRKGISRDVPHQRQYQEHAQSLGFFLHCQSACSVQVIGCIETRLSNLASLHISCCFLGFTCFLNTWRRPRS